MSDGDGPVLPGLPRIPLVGSKVALARLFRDPLRILPRLYREYGEVAALNRGDPAVVCAFGPAHNRQLLPHSRQFEHVGEVPLRIPAGSALEHMQANLTAFNGSTHRRQRRLMMPAFARSAIDGYRDDMVEATGRALEGWAPGDTVDVTAQMLGLTRDIMMKCLFGLDAGPDARALGAMGTEFLRRVISPATALLPLDVPITPYGRLLRLCERMEQRIRALVRARRGRAGEGRDVLSRLIAAHDDDGVGLSELELLGNMGLLFVAGHETTAYALTWILLLLAQHPRERAALRSELLRELRGEPPAVEDLGRLRWLDAVVKEGLRLLPPTYMMFVRRAVGEFELGGHRLPAGAMVVLSPLVTHHMEALYPDAERFVPGRWLETKAAPFAFLPFGAGPRMCLGAAFAEQEIRLVLAMIVSRVDLRPADGTRVDVQARGITMGPRRALPMRVHPAGAAPGGPAAIGGTIDRFVRW